MANVSIKSNKLLWLFISTLVLLSSVDAVRRTRTRLRVKTSTAAPTPEPTPEPEPEPEETAEETEEEGKEGSEFLLAEECSEEDCELPDCRCSGLRLPKDEFEDHEEEIPQFVVVTFDDAITALNFEMYQTLFGDLKTLDNCSAHGTFFVSHEYTDYTKVHALYAEGHEIALHSITHGSSTDYWRKASVDLIEREFGDQMLILEKFALINKSDLRGMRLPFLQLAGNNTFIAGKKLGLQYDCSMPTQAFTDPPMWPYTLDYKSLQDCQIGPCPEVSVPGFWVAPMVAWTDIEDYRCAMIDACYSIPEEEDDIFEFILGNFERHYDSTRAPFGMFMHSSLFGKVENFFGALKKFLEHVTQLPNVYVSPMSQVIEYMKNPVLGKPYKTCPKKPETKTCSKRMCSLRKGTDGEMRYMTVCGKCPQAYPWLGNPLGTKQKVQKKQKTKTK